MAHRRREIRGFPFDARAFCIGYLRFAFFRTVTVTVKRSLSPAVRRAHHDTVTAHISTNQAYVSPYQLRARSTAAQSAHHLSLCCAPSLPTDPAGTRHRMPNDYGCPRYQTLDPARPAPPTLTYPGGPRPWHAAKGNPFPCDSTVAPHPRGMSMGPAAISFGEVIRWGRSGGGGGGVGGVWWNMTLSEERASRWRYRGGEVKVRRVEGRRRGAAHSGRRRLLRGNARRHLPQRRPVRRPLTRPSRGHRGAAGRRWPP